MNHPNLKATSTNSCAMNSIKPPQPPPQPLSSTNSCVTMPLMPINPNNGHGQSHSHGHGLPFKNVRVVASLTFLQFCFAIYATFLLYFMSPAIDLMTGDHSHNFSANPNPNLRSDPPNPNLRSSSSSSSSSSSLASQIADQWKGLVGHSAPQKLLMMDRHSQQEQGLLLSANHHHHHHHHHGEGDPDSPSSSSASSSTTSSASASSSSSSSLGFRARSMAMAMPRDGSCEHEQILFEQKKPNDQRLLALKKELFEEIISFQKQTRGSCETLAELLALPSATSSRPDQSLAATSSRPDKPSVATSSRHDQASVATSSDPSKPLNPDKSLVAMSSNVRDNSSNVRDQRPDPDPDTSLVPPDKTYPRVTVVLNHFKRKTLCAQLDALLAQTLPVHTIWVLAFGSPHEASFRHIVDMYDDPRISFVSSSHDFKYYGRFQLALQSDGADFVYIIDDDMIPGRKVVQTLAHIAGTEKYRNALLGSIGRILPFRQKDYTFPSYRKFGSKEAGIYLPDPAYDIVVDRMVQVDFLSSSWFLPADLVKTIFVETPFTFSTGEDLHLSYQLQKYRDVGSFVVPIDPNDKDTWADSEHRLAQISETTVIYKDVVQVRDDQWWRALTRGYITQWSLMHPQRIDALIYAHSLQDVADFAPMIHRFRTTHLKKAFLVVPGGSLCPCEEAAVKLGWPASVCHERRFKIFDLEVGAIARSLVSDISLMQEIYSAFKGLIKIHSPALVLATEGVPSSVRDGLAMAVTKHGRNTSLVFLPRNVIPHSLWITNLRLESLQAWGKPKISINIVTQNRAKSLQRLLNSLSNGYYLGDEIALSFNMDSKVDEDTLMLANNFSWPHGPKLMRRRIIQGGLIRAVSESWYPTSDDDYGLLLEDDIEVSPFYYMWLKYALLAYKYDPFVSLPELNAIALYTPRLIEVVHTRPKWNATDFFKDIHPNMPYLHQLPCSWGALFFPKHWREFYRYMGTRYTEDAKQNPVKIPRSRTNGWQASWKKFLIDMMYLRGYVALYPNFPGQASFSTNHMEPGAHINAIDNVVVHRKEDFEVPLLMKEDFWLMLPEERLPPSHRLPVLNLFNQPTSLRGLKGAGSKLKQDVLTCEDGEVVVVDHHTGSPLECSRI